MTTGFDTQQATFGPILKTTPKIQIVGAKLPAQEKLARPTPVEPRTFDRTK